MLSHSPSLYFPQWPTVAHICYYLHSLAIILGVQCPNSSVIDTGLKVLSSWFALQASNIQQNWGSWSLVMIWIIWIMFRSDCWCNWSDWRMVMSPLIHIIRVNAFFFFIHRAWD